MSTLKQRLARVIPYFRDNSRAALGLASMAMVVAAATEPMIPYILKHLLNSGFKDTSGLPIWAVPAAIVVLFMIRGTSWWVSSYGLTKASQNAVLAVRAHMFSHMLRAAPQLFTRNSASSITNNIVYEIQTGANLLMGSVQILVRDSLTALFFVGYLIILNWRLTLFVVVLFPIVGLLVRVVSKRLHKLNVAGQNATDDLAYVVEENVLAWRIVRLHGAASRNSAASTPARNLMRSLNIKQQASGSLMTPVTQVLASFALAAVLWMALAESSKTGGTPGDFVAFITCMLLLIQPAKHLSDVMAPLTRGTAAMERGLDMMEQSHRVRRHAGPGARARRHRVPRRRLRYDARGAAEPDDASPAAALSDITLDIRAGETIAFVGPSGAGKTSLVNLLPRFVEPSAGEILIDGAAAARLRHGRAARPVRAGEPGRGAVQRQRGRQRGARRHRPTPRACVTRSRARTCWTS